MEKSENGPGLGSRAKGALWKSLVLLGILGIIFESLRNSLTWYATKFWGGAGDTWQEMWNSVLERVSKHQTQCYSLKKVFLTPKNHDQHVITFVSHFVSLFSLVMMNGLTM